MALAADAGSQVVCATATRGELGTPDPTRWPPRRLAAERTLELARCLRILGVTEHHWLGFVTVGRAAGVVLGSDLYLVAMCHAVDRAPALGVPVARECLRVAEATTDPTARSMARYALGLMLKKADPPRALALLDEAARLACRCTTCGGRASR